MASRYPNSKHVVKPSATTADTNSRSIGRDVTQVSVLAVTNGVDDWITLPSLVSVPEGRRITILCNAGGNFELRTPAGSAEEINSEDCDGTKEYLCTDTQIVYVTKISNTIGWEANAFTAIGAVATAVVPD